MIGIIAFTIVFAGFCWFMDSLMENAEEDGIL